jgi:hypothetical protein
MLDHRGTREDIIDHDRLIVGARPEQEFIGEQLAATAHDRLSADEELIFDDRGHAPLSPAAATRS